MPFRIVRSVLVLAACAALLSGCSEEPEPTQRVQYGTDLLDMVISDRWALESSTPDEHVYRHKDVDDVRLRLSNQVEDFGQPLRIPQVKAIVGKELNMTYGGVSTRVSLGGNAMIKYTRFSDDADLSEAMRLEEWVLAKPTGHSEILRVEISLQIPPESEEDPALPSIIHTLDQQVGDARIPRA